MFIPNLYFFTHAKYTKDLKDKHISQPLLWRYREALIPLWKSLSSVSSLKTRTCPDDSLELTAVSMQAHSEHTLLQIEYVKNFLHQQENLKQNQLKYSLQYIKRQTLQKHRTEKIYSVARNGERFLHLLVYFRIMCYVWIYFLYGHANLQSFYGIQL